MNILDAIKKVLVNEFPTEVIDIQDNKIIIEFSLDDFYEKIVDFYSIVLPFAEEMDLTLEPSVKFRDDVFIATAEFDLT